MRTSGWAVLCLSVAAAACGGRMDRGDAGPAADGAVGTDAGPATDAGPGADAGPGVDAGPGADAGPGVDGGPPSVCTPAPGAMAFSGGCDLFELAVLERDGMPAEARLSGRIYPTGTTGAACAVVDGVDVLSGGVGSAVVAHLDGEPYFALDSGEHPIAHGLAVADMTTRCASDDPAQRFEVYGLVVRGRVDGGTFEAHCALAEGGGRWPPAIRVTCHHNVESPAYGGNAMVSLGSFMGHTYASTSLYALSPHGPSGALTTIDDTIHVIPRREPFDPGAPLVSHDTTGWMGAPTEMLPPSPPVTELSAFASTAALDTDLCPPPSTTPPGPGWVAPPVFLARLTGTGGHGAYSTEVFVNGCYTVTSPPTP